MLKKTEKTTASRYASTRLHYDEAKAYEIIDEALFCTVSYVHEGQPFAIPTAHVRVGNKLYIHGSVGSHFLRGIASGEPVCISIMIADDLVVAKSAFNHSVNYRSVILFSSSVLIDNYEEKAKFFEYLTEKLVPNSWSYLRPMKNTEVNKTMLLAFEIEEASVKVRSGESSDEPEDDAFNLWTGRIPIVKGFGTPIPDNRAENIELPKHLRF